MAGIFKKADNFYCSFWYGGKRLYFALGKVTEEQARARGTHVDKVLDLIE